MIMLIKVKNISKSYNNKLVLDNISFNLNKGEIVGFLGPNGAGKSTLMKIICSFTKQSSGTILINGKDNLKNEKYVKKKIGFLSENNPLYEYMYVTEFLHFIKNIHNKDIEDIDRVIEITGLKNVKTKKISTLSKGYKQRVGIAQALIHDPEILILDEPTSGLDPNQLMNFRKVILNISREKCIIFSSHILQEIESVCDRIIIIKQGEIVLDEKQKNIKKSLEETFNELINK